MPEEKLNCICVKMRVHAAAAAFSAVLYLANLASPVTAVACTEVERTSDKCRSAAHIWLDHPVQSSVQKGGGRVEFKLIPSVRQIYWYCGSSRERTGWGEAANRLDVEFVHDGTIRWWIYKCEDCTYVDRTTDWCRSQAFIQVLGQTIYKGTYNRVIALPGLSTQVFWFCGNNNERTGWGGLANQLTIKYFSDGKIEWSISRCN